MTERRVGRKVICIHTIFRVRQMRSVGAYDGLRKTG